MGQDLQGRTQSKVSKNNMKLENRIQKIVLMNLIYLYYGPNVQLYNEPQFMFM